jgi:hypothetical protein
MSKAREAPSLYFLSYVPMSSRVMKWGQKKKGIFSTCSNLENKLMILVFTVKKRKDMKFVNYYEEKVVKEGCFRTN